jgi:hypothetical protein
MTCDFCRTDSFTPSQDDMRCNHVMAPRVRVEVLDSRSVAPGRWQFAWLVHNDAHEQLELEAAWIPHGRFRGDGRLPLSGVVEPGQATRLEFAVTAAEPPGTDVENAFLILRVASHGEAWRIFARMRITFDARAVPRPSVELITTQSIE